MYLNYAENLFILSSTVTGCVSISAFASLVFVPVEITSTAVGINICAITAGFKSISQLKKKKKKHNKIALLRKDTIEFLTSKALISHDEFLLVNNVLR